MSEKFKKLSNSSKRAKIKSNVEYYFTKNFINDDIVKEVNKKVYNNGSWIEYKEFEVTDKFTGKKYKYNFSCKYKLGDIIKGTSKRFIECLYVSKFKVLITDI
ncbi:MULTISPECIES: hypothetical protein [unclassified Clostridium]|uniref:hypothetical protein n=1 Tax=unclassified Clostridium TaxID=2614128 RepID=UPI0025BA6875|nr:MULTISPECIES: hypothetical protein [unclassified Clostridium]